MICTECLKAQGTFCRGCDACAPCLEKKGVESCVDCGWCYACVGLKSVEHLGYRVGLAFKAEGNFCRGCGACAPCLERKDVEFCVDCGWCDACVGHKSVEWESRKKRRDDEDGGQGFWMPQACKHHVPEYGKTLDMKCERQESENEEGYIECQDETKDEPKESEANQENGQIEEKNRYAYCTLRVSLHGSDTTPKDFKAYLSTAVSKHSQNRASRAFPPSS